MIRGPGYILYLETTVELRHTPEGSNLAQISSDCFGGRFQRYAVDDNSFYFSI